MTRIEHEVAVAQAAYRQQHGDPADWEPYEFEALERLTERVAADAEAQEQAGTAEGGVTR